MKLKTLLALLLTSCWLTAQVLPTARAIATPTPAADGGCATTDTAILHDEFLEGFQAASVGYNDGNAWTWSETGTTANLSATADVTAIFAGVSGACSQGMSITVPNSTETYYQWDRGSELDLDTQGVLITFYVTFDTLGLSGTKNHAIFDVASAAVTQSFLVTLQFVTDHHELKLDASVDAGTSYTVTTGVAYKVEIYVATTAANSWFDVNDASGTSNTFTRYGSRDLQYIRAGAPTGVDSADGGSVYRFDLICADKQ